MATLVAVSKSQKPIKKSQNPILPNIPDLRSYFSTTLDFNRKLSIYPTLRDARLLGGAPGCSPDPRFLELEGPDFSILGVKSPDRGGGGDSSLLDSMARGDSMGSSLLFWIQN